MGVLDVLKKPTVLVQAMNRKTGALHRFGLDWDWRDDKLAKKRFEDEQPDYQVQKVFYLLGGGPVF